jgi:uncharacterized membrane-anchored protein
MTPDELQSALTTAINAAAQVAADKEQLTADQATMVTDAQILVDTVAALRTAIDAYFAENAPKFAAMNANQLKANGDLIAKILAFIAKILPLLIAFIPTVLQPTAKK